MENETWGERLAIIETNVDWIRKALEGNGKKGLIQRVEDLETCANQSKGAVNLVQILIQLGSFLFGSGIMYAIVKMGGQ